MNLQLINDQELLSLSKEKAQVERNLTLEIIEILQEIRNRHLHLKRGFSSLHEYCVKELQYSDGAAHRRLKAMRLVEDVPQAKASIESGALSLSTASQLQVVFEQKAKENKPVLLEMKKALLTQAENKSRREAEKVLVEICPQVVRHEQKISHLSSSQVKLELIVDQKFLEKLERLKALTSHKNKNLKELLHDLVDEALFRKDPLLKDSRKVESRTGGNPKGDTIKRHINPQRQTRHIPVPVRQEVWMRDRGVCTYVDSQTKRSCDSNYKIQFEHIVPYSFGGPNTATNLRLLCANHNQLTAQRIGRRTQSQTAMGRS